MLNIPLHRTTLPPLTHHLHLPSRISLSLSSHLTPAHSLHHSNITQISSICPSNIIQTSPKYHPNITQTSSKYHSCVPHISLRHHPYVPHLSSMYHPSIIHVSSIHHHHPSSSSSSIIPPSVRGDADGACVLRRRAVHVEEDGTPLTRTHVREEVLRTLEHLLHTAASHGVSHTRSHPLIHPSIHPSTTIITPAERPC